jgi:hypothetical protein
MFQRFGLLYRDVLKLFWRDKIVTINVTNPAMIFAAVSSPDESS